MTPVETAAFPVPGAGSLQCCHGAIRSYDHRGRVFSWQPPAGLAYRRAALDVEAKDQPSAAEMSARFGLSEDEFLRRWTATEAIAKAFDVPILDLLKRQGLSREATDHWQQDATGVWVLAIEHPTHWATVAAAL